MRGAGFFVGFCLACKKKKERKKERAVNMKDSTEKIEERGKIKM